ncbi:DNA helicase rad5, partial [Tieghemiomyces parasiticus]
MKAPPCRITDFFCAPGRTGPTRTAGPSRDNVERARRKPPTSPSPVTKRPRRETAAPPAACEGVVYLGEFLCIGYLTTCRGANLQAGDPLDISRTYVPTPPSRSRGPRSTIPPSAIPESGLGAALTAYTQRTRNTIVRFGRGPQELGRLRQDSANVVAPLLDLGLLELTAAVVYVARPATPQLGDEVVMRAQAYLPRAAFDNPTFVAWQCGFDPVVAETWDDPIATELRERVQLDAQTALHALFARCGLTAHTDRPAVPDVIDLDSSNDGGSQGETGHVPEQDLASTDDQPSVQLDALFTPAAAGAGVLDLPEHPAPPTLAYTLHPYQCQALGWMLARERPATPSPVKCGGVLPGEDLALMDPAWLRFVLPSDIDRQADDPDRFYFHPHTGQLALRFPRVGRCHAGGILADEMGLGKTIEMLALLHADAASDPEPSLDPDRCPTSATLVVCPLSLLSQWQDEARQSSRPGTVRVHLHYGPGRDLTALAAPASEPVTVVVTSYHTLLADYTAFTTGTTPARTSLFNYHFRRVILDEAHTIKARHTQSFKACYALSTTRRWAVTGTPYINGLGDLFSLLHFLR